MGRHDVEPYDWAVRFEQEARDRILSGENTALIQYEKLGATRCFRYDARPLPAALVRAGNAAAHDAASFPIEGVDGGSVSMLAVKVG